MAKTYLRPIVLAGFILLGLIVGFAAGYHFAFRSIVNKEYSRIAQNAFRNILNNDEAGLLEMKVFTPSAIASLRTVFGFKDVKTFRIRNVTCGLFGMASSISVEVVLKDSVAVVVMSSSIPFEFDGIGIWQDGKRIVQSNFRLELRRMA